MGEDADRRLHAMSSGTAPDSFEDGDGEVYAHWIIPSGICTSDIQVDIAVQHLTVRVRDVVLFDQELAHRVVPSQSSWTYDAPDVGVTLCKSRNAGAYPRWGVLKAEALGEKRARWGGM